VWEEERCVQVFGGATLGKETTWRAQPRWEDNIKMELQVVEWVACTGLIWFRIEVFGGHL
jgi:hypothetical protein